MSRTLPSQPNLEFLKKQAKDLLPTLQQQNASAQLSDAQHALAKEYGFASWPKLEAHLAGTPARTTSPLAGTWTGNLTRSRRSPHNMFQGATMHIAVSGDTVSIEHVVINVAGGEDRGVNTMLVDGVGHPWEHGSGYLVTAQWRGPRMLEAVGTKDGEVVGRGLYEVSADGKTLTVTSDEQVIVLDRTP